MKFSTPYYVPEEYTAEERTEMLALAQNFPIAKAVITASLPHGLNWKTYLSLRKFSRVFPNIQEIDVNGDRLVHQPVATITAGARRTLMETLEPFAGREPTLEELIMLQVYVPGLPNGLLRMKDQFIEWSNQDTAFPQHREEFEKYLAMPIMQGTMELSHTVQEMTDAIGFGVSATMREKFLASDTWRKEMRQGTPEEREFAEQQLYYHMDRRSHEQTNGRGYQMIRAYEEMRGKEMDENTHTEKSLEVAQIEPTLLAFLRKQFGGEVLRILKDNIR